MRTLLAVQVQVNHHGGLQNTSTVPLKGWVQGLHLRTPSKYLEPFEANKGGETFGGPGL